MISSFEFEKQTNVYDRCRLAVDSDYAYIASGQKGLYIIDISDPYHLQQVGIYTSNDPYECINDVKVYDNIAYVADSIKGLVILDIHDKSNPKVSGYIVRHPEQPKLFQYKAIMHILMMEIMV